MHKPAIFADAAVADIEIVDPKISDFVGNLRAIRALGGSDSLQVMKHR